VSERKIASSRQSSATAFQNNTNLSLTGIRPDGLAEHPDSLRYNSFPHSNRNSKYSQMLDIVQTCCARSSRCLAETFQTVSTSEIQLYVEIGTAWTIVRTELLLTSWRLQLNLLDTVGRPEAFRGSSGRLHRNQFFFLGICKESSWTSFRNLWSVTCFEMNIVRIYEDTEIRTDHPVNMQLLHKVFLLSRMLPT
jgi:hypothetical protein